MTNTTKQEQRVPVSTAIQSLMDQGIWDKLPDSTKSELISKFLLEETDFLGNTSKTNIRDADRTKHVGKLTDELHHWQRMALFGRKLNWVLIIALIIAIIWR